MDHVGPMARSAEDCLEVMKLIAGFDINDKYSYRTKPDFFDEKKFDTIETERLEEIE